MGVRISNGKGTSPPFHPGSVDGWNEESLVQSFAYARGCEPGCELAWRWEPLTRSERFHRPSEVWCLEWNGRNLTMNVAWGWEIVVVARLKRQNLVRRKCDRAIDRTPRMSQRRFVRGVTTAIELCACCRRFGPSSTWLFAPSNAGFLGIFADG